MKVLYITTALALLASGIQGEEMHAHEDEHPCACEAEEFGFTIDCTDTTAMTDALALLQTNNCDADCTSDVCFVNFLIIQSHHDHCLHEDVPENVEDNFHTYEGGCIHCAIQKQFDPDLEPCPAAVCDSTTGNDAYQQLLTNNCLEDCSTATCTTYYRILRSEHDSCAADVLDTQSELGLHNYEEICEDYSCNVATGTFELTCDPEDLHEDHDHAGHDHSDEHPCGCEAEEFGFTIDCSDSAAMTAALAELSANNCDTVCDSTVCMRNFFIIQSHHDHCLHDDVPEPVEDDFHVYESVCEHCAIAKLPDPALPECPAAMCDSSGDDAYAVMVSNGCESDCSSTICGTNYRILRSEHDTCAEDVLSMQAEIGIHNFEDICEDYGCNVNTGPVDISCPADAMEGMEAETTTSTSGGVEKKFSVAVLALTAAAFM